MDYLSLNDYFRSRYGAKVYKLSLQSGCTCPNRDGTAGYGGCAFCSEDGSGDFASAYAPLDIQIEAAKTLVDPKFPKGTVPEDRLYMAYFQSFSNTYGDIGRLERLYSEALARPEIVGISLGTRPDCLPQPMVEMLAGLNRRKPVWVELGLQTVNEKVAADMNRGYSLPVFDDAYERLKAAGLTVVIHVILGLPGENREDMLDTVRYIAAEKPSPDGVKLQLLHVLKGTELGRRYEKAPFPTMGPEEYCSLVVECLRILPPDTVVHRITGDPPKRLLIAPQWCTDKKRVLNMLRAAIRGAER